MAAVPLSEFAVHLRPEDNIAVAAGPSPPAPSSPSTARPSASPAAIGMGHKFAVRADQGGRGGPQVRPDHRLRQPGHRAGRPRPRPQRHAPTRSSATTPSAATARRRSPPPAEHRTFMGYDRGPTARPPALRHAQLHRDHQHRELLGQHEQVHRRARPRQRACSSSIPNVDGVVADHAQGGLRDAVRRARPPAARPHAGRLRQAPERRRVHPRRPGLRDVPGDPPDRERAARSVSSTAPKKHADWC